MGIVRSGIDEENSYILDGIDVTNNPYAYHMIMEKCNGEAPWEGVELQRSTSEMSDMELTRHYMDFSPSNMGASYGMYSVVDLKNTVSWHEFSPEDILIFFNSMPVGEMIRDFATTVAVVKTIEPNSTPKYSQKKPEADYSDVYKKAYEGASQSNTSRVGQWMSEAEYKTFLETGEIPRTNVLTEGMERYMKQANYGDYYVEFDIDSSLLVPKNEEIGWSLIKSKNQMYLKLAEMKDEILPLPIGENIEHIFTK